MSESERIRLGRLLTQIARPHRVDEGLSAEVQAGLWQLGVQCGATTPRADLVAHLWAIKRTTLKTTPPNAA